MVNATVSAIFRGTLSIAMNKRKKALNILVFLLVLSTSVYLSLLLAQYVSADDVSQKLIQDFGHLGILVISFVAGLNALVPVPAATFVPVFTAGGISLPTIIIFLTIGTMAANLISFAIGVYGGNITETHYPHIQKKLLAFYKGKERWLPYFVLGFAALIPFPDEVYLIPLGIIGIKLRHFIIPLTIGTFLYQAMAAYGVDNVFKYFLL
jgi:membrane protein YqaA with SNARE-associated domain